MLAAHGGLLGSAVADLVAAFAGTVAVLIYLRSSALVAQVRTGPTRSRAVLVSRPP